MSSGDRLNYQQLQMFMPAKHLIEMPFHEPDREWIETEEEEWIDSDGESSWEGGGRYLEDDDQFWDRKLDESYRRSYGHLYDKITKSGQVNVPVDVGFDEDEFGGEHLSIRDGHHRIAAATEVNPDMEVPINYFRYQWQGPPT